MPGARDHGDIEQLAHHTAEPQPVHDIARAGVDYEYAAPCCRRCELFSSFRKVTQTSIFTAGGEYFDRLQGIITGGIVGSGLHLVRGLNRRADCRAPDY